MSVSLPDRHDQASRAAEFWAPVAARTATAAGVFVVFVLATLAWAHAQRLAKDPLDSELFRALKAHLAELKGQPASDAVRQDVEATLVEIRAEDLHLRQEYFAQRRFAARGAWLLLGGMAVFLAASKLATTLGRKLPVPDSPNGALDADTRRARVGRWSVAGLGIVLAGAMLALSAAMRPALPDSWSPAQALAPAAPEPAPQQPPVAVAALPSREECLKNWPGFRGFTGSGVAPDDDWPTRWDIKSGEGIIWKSAVPLPGNSSPVVWGDRLFLTGGSRQVRQVFCYDTANGRLLWQCDVPGTAPGELTVNDETGYASPTPATDGRRVYVAFATGDLVAFDFAGNPAWARSLGAPKSAYGHAASLRVHGNRLLVQLDQGTEREGLSRLVALDTATGQTAWEVKRPVPNSWSSPIIAEVNGQEQVIACGDPWVIAYSPADGRELWRADCLKGDVAPSPVLADGVVYAAVEGRGTSAIRADGQGDVTKSHVRWSVEDGAPDAPSPLVVGGSAFLLAGSRLTCLDAQSSNKRWEMDVDGLFMASPSAAGKYLYLFDANGKAFVVEPGATESKVVFTTAMGDRISASPAFQGGRLFVRGEKELFCIGKQ
jgi:outer membrane protein assembly factor BamB